MSSVVELRTGSQVWLDGEVWTVRELGAQSCLLSAEERVRRVASAALAERARVLGLTDECGDVEDRELVNVVLGNLTAQQQGQLEARGRVVRSLIDPATADPAVSLNARYQAAAAELGVSVRTLERWVAGYRDAGLAGLADSRMVGKYTSGVDARWDAACLAVLSELTTASTPTMNVVLDRVNRRLEDEHGVGVVACPTRTTGYRRLNELAKGRYSFGSAKARRSVAQRPKGAFGRLRATRPGEYVVLDTTPLDVFAMEPVTLRWVPVELTIAQDLYTRCVLGLRLTPVSTRAADVANVLYQCLTPQPSGEDDGSWPFHGVPRNLLVATEEPDGVSQQRVGGMPACLPEAIVVDHGKTYLSTQVVSACARLGITVQPAIPNKPTDKPTLERFFRTLRQGLLQHLPAYKGPDVYNRGKDIEGQAFFYVAELEQVIREWVGSVYHRTKHAGLCLPEIPGASFSPTELFEIGLAKTGGLLLPASRDLAYQFLEVAWRTIQHYGVEVNGLRYDGAALNLHRNTRSPHGGVYAGKWPIFIDTSDVRQVYFQDPTTKAWHPLAWEHAPALEQPFSQDAVDYAKQIALRTDRHVDPLRAVQELLAAWSRDEVTSRRDRTLALRLSSQRATTAEGLADERAPDAARQVASLPGVIDLVAAREHKGKPLHVVDDLDVFERYYAEHPDEAGLAVFDE